MRLYYGFELKGIPFGTAFTVARWLNADVPRKEDD